MTQAQSKETGNMYQLYGTKMTGTCAVHAALAELDVPFEFVEVTTKERQHLTEEYQRVNPRQQVPALMLPDGSSNNVYLRQRLDDTDCLH